MRFDDPVSAPSPEFSRCTKGHSLHLENIGLSRKASYQKPSMKGDALMSRTKTGVATTVGLIGAMLASQAHAQSAGSNDSEIAMLRQQLRLMEQKLDKLQRQTAANTAAAANASAKADDAKANDAKPDEAKSDGKEAAKNALPRHSARVVRFTYTDSLRPF